MKKVSSFSLLIILAGAAALLTVGAAPRHRSKAAGAPVNAMRGAVGVAAEAIPSSTLRRRHARSAD